MKRIDRKEAIYFLTIYQLLNINSDRREEILIDYYSENDEFEKIIDFSDTKYDRDVIQYLTNNFIGVQNYYIANSIMNILSCTNVVVEGKVELLEKCPCCEYRTLEKRGHYFICPVCFWEDDGSDDLERYSPPNHEYLKNARINFLRVGAMSESLKGSIDPNSKEKYLK